MIVSRLVCLLFFGLAFTLSGAAPSPPPSSPIAEDIGQQIDSFLALRFPHVAPSERKHIGEVPENLDHLITGASRSGRLTLPLPPPGHALLLTQTESPITIRYVGIINDVSGIRYFRTLPIELQPIPTDRSWIPINPQIHSLPFSTDATRRRQAKIDLGNGKTYTPAGKFALHHISLLPVYTRGEIGVYHDWVLTKVLSGQTHGVVQWSRRPNWENRDEIKAALDVRKWPERAKKKFGGVKSAFNAVLEGLQERLQERLRKLRKGQEMASTGSSDR